jgi:hypothetical protein
MNEWMDGQMDYRRRRKICRRLNCSCLLIVDNYGKYIIRN